jgi:tRNA A-37 threonylcarbamoyl transferase component Bud32
MTGQAHFEEQLKTQLAPDFEVKRLIGTGSKASVYLAREAALKRLVAIKVLKPQLAADETARKRFEREAQSAAQISHPNVAKIYTVGRLEGDVPYLVMEYIDGRTLEEALKATGLLPVKDARRVIRDLAGALEAAHGKRIIHRDVRPANVLVENETKRVVLTDFGIAAILESGGSDVTRLTMEGQLLGEMRYMSPEQLQGERATEQADLYSLGILGFELLTGESPYRVNSDIELAAAHLRQTPRKITELRADAPADLESLVDRCLAKQPGHRPTAADVVASLDEKPAGAGAAAGGGAHDLGPRPESALGAFFYELRRRKVLRVAGGYVLATIVLILDVGERALEFVGVVDPNATLRVVVGVLLAGFPLVVALAWRFDLTGGTIVRTQEVPDSQKSTRGLRWLGLTVSLAVSALIAWFYF